VPDGYTTILVNVSITRANPAPATLPVSGSLNTPTIRVLDSAGAEILSLKDGDAPVSKSVPAVKGAWAVRYEGAGTSSGSVVITAFA
jgi:hypothetical protein